MIDLSQTNCAGNVAPFFADDPTEAKGLCATCTQRDACLDTALTYERGMRLDRRVGVYGGLTPQERHVLASHGAC